MEKAELIKRFQQAMDESKAAYDRHQQFMGAAQTLQRLIQEMDVKEKAEAAEKAQEDKPRLVASDQLAKNPQPQRDGSKLVMEK